MAHTCLWGHFWPGQGPHACMRWMLRRDSAYFAELQRLGCLHARKLAGRDWPVGGKQGAHGNTTQRLDGSRRRLESLVMHDGVLLHPR